MSRLAELRFCAAGSDRGVYRSFPLENYSMEIRVSALTGELVKQEVQVSLLKQQLDLKETAVLTLYNSIAQVSPASISVDGDVYIPSGAGSSNTATYRP